MVQARAPTRAHTGIGRLLVAFVPLRLRDEVEAAIDLLHAQNEAGEPRRIGFAATLLMRD